MTLLTTVNNMELTCLMIIVVKVLTMTVTVYYMIAGA